MYCTSEVSSGGACVCVCVWGGGGGGGGGLVSIHVLVGDYCENV